MRCFLAVSELTYMLLGTVVKFDQPMYKVSENETLRTFLVLDKPSSAPITIQLRSIDISTTGEYYM